MALRRSRHDLLNDVDFLLTVGLFPGCMLSSLPEGHLALLGYADMEEVQVSNRAGPMDVPRFGDSISVILRLVTSRGRILSMPQWQSPDAQVAHDVERVDARELISSVLGISVRSLCMLHQEWTEESKKPGYEMRCSMYCVTVEHSDALHALLKHDASLVLEKEIAGATDIQEQVRYVYPKSLTIEQAEWQDPLDDQVRLVDAETSGVVYRSRGNMAFIDLLDTSRRRVFTHLPWQERLIEWVETLHADVRTASQGVAYTMLRRMVTSPDDVIDVDEFAEALTLFPDRAPNGMIPIREIFGGAVYRRCIRLEPWRLTDTERDPQTDAFPDIRYVKIS